MKNRKEKFSEKQAVMELADDGAFSIEKTAAPDIQ